MKQVLLLLTFITFMGLNATAQTADYTPDPATVREARSATDALASKYRLSEEQKAGMYTIQLRKLRNTAAIAPLKSSDPAKYQAKVASLQKGTLASIRRLLNTPEQKLLYQQTQREVRSRKSDLRKTMLVQNASKAAIEAAQLAVYAE